MKKLLMIALCACAFLNGADKQAAQPKGEDGKQLITHAIKKIERTNLGRELNKDEQDKLLAELEQKLFGRVMTEQERKKMADQLTFTDAALAAFGFPVKLPDLDKQS